MEFVPLVDYDDVAAAYNTFAEQLMAGTEQLTRNVGWQV